MSVRRRSFGTQNNTLFSVSPTIGLLIGVVFFVLVLASNHYSDFHSLLALTASQTPFITSSTNTFDKSQICQNTKQGKLWVTDDKGKRQKETKTKKAKNLIF